jgi:hypothetical protein
MRAAELLAFQAVPPPLSPHVAIEFEAIVGLDDIMWPLMTTASDAG